jgi:hypothetical protein
MRTTRTNQNGILILIATVLVAGAAACGGRVDAPATGQAAVAPAPASNPDRVVPASDDTHQSWGIRQWHVFTAAGDRPGRVEGVDEQDQVVSTIMANPLSRSDEVLTIAVSYTDRRFEQQMQSGRLLATSGDASLAPLIVAMGRDHAAAAASVGAAATKGEIATQAVNACTQDWVNFGGATVGTIATCATVETGFGILLCCAAAGIAWDVAIIVLRDCWGI